MGKGVAAASANPMRVEVVLKFSQFKGLLALLLICLSLPALSEAKRHKAVVSGVVRAASVDPKGKVLAVEIMVGESEEEPYMVADTGKGKELRDLVGAFVMAGGYVTEDERGWKTIEVTNYTTTDQLQQP